MLVAQVLRVLFNDSFFDKGIVTWHLLKFSGFYFCHFLFSLKIKLLMWLPHIQALLFHKLGRSWRKTIDKVR